MPQNLEYIQIEPTTRCNYTCGFCAGRHMSQTDLEFSIFRNFVDTVNHIKHMELQGEGEPLLHPQFFEMIVYARKRFPSLAISFITNGSLFTEKNIENILSANIHTILISIESADEAEFQHIRGGKLSRVVRGIKELIERKRELNSELKVGFAITVLKQTVRQISAIGELYNELNMDGGISIQPLQSMESYAQFYSQQMTQSIPSRDDTVAIKQLIATDSALKYAINTYQYNKSFFSELFSQSNQKNDTCPWLENGLYISAEGIATSCCFTKNIKEDGYASIENNLEKILKLRAFLSERFKEKKPPRQCKGCGIARNILRRNSSNTL